MATPLTPEPLNPAANLNVASLQPTAPPATAIEPAAPAETTPTKAGEDGFDILAREMQKVNAGAQQQPQTPQETLQKLPTPIIPPPPAPVPGAYNPDQEQAAMRATMTIADPERRMRVQQFLKREYANDAMMDGIMQRQREDNLKKATSDYTTAIKQVQDDPHAGWQQKQIVAKKLLDAMWKDPRTDYGDTREQLEAHMLGLAGIQNTRGLGAYYTEAFKAVANKEIRDPRQILQMEAEGRITYAGGEHLIKALGDMGKPDREAILHRQALAQQEIKNIVLKDTDENVPGMKASNQQYQKLTDVLFAFNDLILAAGQDQDKIAKVASPEAVRELVERIYPWDQRAVDYMTRGGPINVQGIMIPPTVGTEKRAQEAYRNIVSLTPTLTNKEGKAVQVAQPVWQAAIESIRRNQSPENLAGFRRVFPGQDPDKIIKALPYVAPPAGYAAPVVAPPEAGGFWSSLFHLYGMAPTAPTQEELARVAPGITTHFGEFFSGTAAPTRPTATPGGPGITTHFREFFGGTPAEEAKK